MVLRPDFWVWVSRVQWSVSQAMWWVQGSKEGSAARGILAARRVVRAGWMSACSGLLGGDGAGELDDVERADGCAEGRQDFGAGAGEADGFFYFEDGGGCGEGGEFAAGADVGYGPMSRRMPEASTETIAAVAGPVPADPPKRGFWRRADVASSSGCWLAELGASSMATWRRLKTSSAGRLAGRDSRVSMRAEVKRPWGWLRWAGSGGTSMAD